MACFCRRKKITMSPQLCFQDFTPQKILISRLQKTNLLLDFPESNQSFNTASWRMVSPSIAIFLLPSSILRSPIWTTPFPAACKASQRRFGSAKMWPSLRSRSLRLLSGKALRAFFFLDMLKIWDGDWVTLVSYWMSSMKITKMARRIVWWKVVDWIGRSWAALGVGGLLRVEIEGVKEKIHRGCVSRWMRDCEGEDIKPRESSSFDHAIRS